MNLIGLSNTKIAGLDGLRGIAVIGVLLVHARAPWMAGGFLGVDVFFVLSGFLITWGLLRHRLTAPTMREFFADFYSRRFVRLFPALAILILGVLVFSFTIAPPWIREQSVPSIPYALLSISNWAAVFSFPPGSMGILGHTWSLSVEEQFYLVWPVTLIALLSVRRIPIQGIAYGTLCMAFILALWRVYCIQQGIGAPISIYFRTDTHSDGLFIGSAIALYLFQRDREPVYERFLRPVIFVAGLGFILVAYVYPYLPLWIVQGATLQVSVAAGFVLFSIVTAPAGGWIRRALSNRFLCYIGTISYGL